MSKKNLCLLLLLFLSIQLKSAIDSDFIRKIDPQLILDFELNPVNSCLISLENSIDFDNEISQWNKAQKGEYVYQVLKSYALSTQSTILNYLRSNGIEHRSFLLVNVIRADLNQKQLEEIASMHEVQQISSDPTIQLVKYKMTSTINQKMDPRPEWGIKMIRADSVWNMGFRGEGVVIAGQDTGYDWEHDVLKAKYRGWNADTAEADHNYSWHDAIREINPMHGDSTLEAIHNPCGLDLDYPCDDNNHGTHTMGSMVGSDSLNAIGVAPGAKWIASRNMERGYGTPSTYLESLEWFLAPTDLDGKNPRTDLAPHVINNSWTCPKDEGCNEMNWHLLQIAIRNLKAAGIVFVASAGNDGRDGCGSILKPPALFEESFTVGASNQSDSITVFSSRGPVVIDSSFNLKPEVVAPGRGIRSCIRNNEFANFSGTSMSGPHVVGLVALIINANPSLAGQVEEIEQIIINSAVTKQDTSHCFGLLGEDIPNHVYGHGRIDAVKAIELALAMVSNTETESKLHFKIFPNPSSYKLQLKVSENILVTGVEVFNSMGQSVFYSQTLVPEIDIDQFPNGVYYIKLLAKNDFNIQTFVKT